MALKQISDYKIANDSIGYAQKNSKGDSDQLDYLDELDFDINNKTENPSGSDATESKMETENINKNFRLLFAYYKDLNSEGLLSKRDEAVISAQIKICREKASKIQVILDSKSVKNIYNNRKTDYLNAKLNLYNKRAFRLREKFIKSNLRFVVDLANRYRTKGLPLSDLIQEGNIGLMKAVEKFDHTKGFKFSTYSSWWIHQSLSRATMEQSKVISIPIYLQEQASKIYKAKNKLEHNSSKMIRSEEIAQEAGLSVDVVNTVLRGRHLTVPLEISGVEEDTKTYLDIIPDPNSKNADYYLSEISMTQRVRKLLRKLTDREKDVLKMRFGIDYEDAHKLEQIAEKYSLSRERIRQIERIALQKLGDSKEAEILKEFLT